MSIAEVRLATPEDAKEIARIQRVAWEAAYADLPGALAALDAVDAEQQWTDAIEFPFSTVYLATEGEFNVGFCVAGLAPESEVADASGALPADADKTGLIASLLVEPRWGRRGHAGRLLATAARGLREIGAERGISWVGQSDHPALGFYRRAGWNPDGTVRVLDTGETTIREVRLTGTLDLALA